jgi:hypothetical protein
MQHPIDEHVKLAVKTSIGKIGSECTIPQKRFLGDMLIGLLGSGSTRLTRISSALHEHNSIKATEKRLSRNIQQNDYTDAVNRVLLGEGLRNVGQDDILAIDFSDIAKPYAKRMEHLEKVYDGSEKRVVLGYDMFVAGIVGDTEARLVQSEGFSTHARGYKGKSTYVLRLCDNVRVQRKGQVLPTTVGDRGFDDRRLYTYWDTHNMPYIIRLTTTRVVEVQLDGKRRKIGDLYAFASLTHSLEQVVYEQRVKQTSIEIGFLSVRLPKQETISTVVIVKAPQYNDPMYLITNRRCTTHQMAKKIYRLYLRRWKIEQLIRFMKESYDLEDVRVLKYKALRNVISFVALVTQLVGKITYSIANHRTIKEQILRLKQRIRTTGTFLFYTIADGLKYILMRRPAKIILFPIAYRWQYALFRGHL